MKESVKVLVITESVAESWKRDASTFALAFACFVPGWYLQMASMSVLGVIVFVFATLKSVLKLGNQPMTIEEAKRKIAEIESITEKESN